MNNKSIKDKVSNYYNKNVKKSKNKFSMTETLLFMIIVFGLGLIVGGVIMYGKRAFSSSTISLNEFNSTYNEIVDNYYQDIDKEELLEAGISGMLRYLGDPYSTYMNKETANDFSEDVEGTYQGIGAEMRYNDDKLPIISKVFENSPAANAGLEANDIILKVNDEDVTKWSLTQIANVVKGETGTTVNMTVKRNDEEITVTLTRGVVDNVSVTSELIEEKDKKIGYLYISVFASNTFKQFEKELKALEEKNIDSLIIDVRGNSGGYLNIATELVSLFVKKGEVLYQLRTKDDVEIIYDKTDDERTYPMVVLVDGGSASASELLTAALNETYGAKLIGKKTYGKGKVQKVLTLSSGALFKYTYQEWLTPKGNYIDQVGIKPDIEVEYKSIGEGKDTQKNKAVEVLSN